MGKSRSITKDDMRGNARDRAKRRQFLLDTFGDGTLAPCMLKLSVECLGLLDITNVSSDRHPIPGSQGGTYRRSNIRPACMPCQCLQGAMMSGQRKLKGELVDELLRG